MRAKVPNYHQKVKNGLKTNHCSGNFKLKYQWYLRLLGKLKEYRAVIVCCHREVLKFTIPPIDKRILYIV